MRVDTQTTSGNLPGKEFNCPSCRCLYRIYFVAAVLSLIYPNFILQSYAQDGKNWNDNASCYVYRHNQRYLLTIWNVERGENLYFLKRRRTDNETRRDCFVNMPMRRST